MTDDRRQNTEDRIQKTDETEDQRTEIREQKSDIGNLEWECGLRPIGAIEAYAPEGRWKKTTNGLALLCLSNTCKRDNCLPSTLDIHHLFYHLLLTFAYWTQYFRPTSSR